MPVTVRCPKTRGGCGKLRKVPRSAARSVVPVAAAVTMWDPPSEPRQPRLASEPCPHCGGPVKIEPRGTVRWCAACNTFVTPPGVLAPYQRGAEITRAAKSQRERDDDDKKTVLIAGEFLRQVRAMLDDPQVHPASADLLGWYEEEITEARKARDGRRLAELAAEFAADQEARAFRRRHWWQGQPAALTAGYAGEDDGEDGHTVLGEVVDGQGDEYAPMLAIPASIAAQQHLAQPQRATWADAFTALGWRLAPRDYSSICAVISSDGQRCAEQTGGHPPVNDGLISDGWTCSGHYNALGRAISSINRARRIA